MLLNKSQIYPRPTTASELGFSLVEMAIVLVIVALLLAGLLPTLSGQMELKRIGEARAQLEEVKASLTGFAVSNGRLPCPDTDTPRDGIENFSNTTSISNNNPQTGQSKKTITCNLSEGGLPFNQLGISQIDPYGNNLLYRVKPVFSEKNEIYSGLDASGTLLATTYFGMTDSGNLRVCNTQACSSPRLTDAAVAVIVSIGQNGASAASSDEAENTDGDQDFVGKGFSTDFDDLVVWISPNNLINRMVAAGKLP